MNHLINRLRFEVTMPDEDQAFELRHNFAQTLQLQIMDAVDRVCSRYVGEDELIRIDKLEIDMGRFSPYSFGAGFQDVFLYKFEKELVGKLSALPVHTRENSKQLSYLELFSFFMEKGILPWWCNEQELDWKEVSALLFSRQTDEIRLFFSNSRSNVVVWKRAAFQLSGELKEKLISLFPELMNAKEQMEAGIFQIPEQTEIRPEEGSPAQSPIVRDILLVNATEIFRQKGQGAVLLKPPAETVPEALSDTRKEEIAEKLAVRHAGLVLLTPFLTSFFTKLNLLDGGDWISQEAVYRAIHLLKYLSTGLQQVPEFSLVLEKVICGFSVSEPVPVEIELQEAETKECELLLSSVIEHWKVLKNTSVNGLRESFLKRDGLLSKVEKGWLLQVERKTLDVLLDSIPWGYSTINFHWNEQVIFVEW